jgi:hypothetical protein
MKVWKWMISWKGFWRKRSWPNLKSYPDIGPQGLRKTTKKPQSGKPVSGPRLEPGTSRIRSSDMFLQRSWMTSCTMVHNKYSDLYDILMAVPPLQHPVARHFSQRAECIYRFLMFLRLNRHYFPRQHLSFELCNGFAFCFLWGTDYISKYHVDELLLQKGNELCIPCNSFFSSQLSRLYLHC